MRHHEYASKATCTAPDEGKSMQEFFIAALELKLNNGKSVARVRW